MFIQEFWRHSFTDPAVFWVMATFAVTLALVLVAWIQLRNLAITSRADFLFRLKADFFTNEARKLFALIEEHQLRFDPGSAAEGEIAHFEYADGYRTVSTYDMDDVVLGPLEDVSLFLSDGLITRRQATAMFAHYVAVIAKNAAIQEYIEFARRHARNENIYSGVRKLPSRLV